MNNVGAYFLSNGFVEPCESFMQYIASECKCALYVLSELIEGFKDQNIIRESIVQMEQFDGDEHIGREQGKTCRSVGYFFNIVAILNSLLMIATAFFCNKSNSGVASTMTVISIYSMFHSTYIYHIIAATISLLFNMTIIFIMAKSLTQRYPTFKRVCLCMAICVFVCDLGVPFAIMVTKSSWNAINAYESSSLFLMYGGEQSQTLSLLQILLGVEFILGLTFFLIINAANVFYWLRQLWTQEDDGEERMNSTEMKLEIKQEMDSFA